LKRRSNGLEFCCRTIQVALPGRPATQLRSAPARRGASRCRPNRGASRPHPEADPVSSNSVLGRERNTKGSRSVAARAALHRDLASHRDPPRIAALVASRTTSTQVTALRCDRRDSGVASRHSSPSRIDSRPGAQRIAGWRRLALGGRGAAAGPLLGPQISLPNGLEFCCRTGQVASRGRPTTQPRGAPARRGASRCRPSRRDPRLHRRADPVSSNSVLDRERRTKRSRVVAWATLRRDLASHCDPPRIAALVASRITSTQVTALRCDRRDSSVASRHFLSGLDQFPSRGATHRGVASLRARGDEGPQPAGSSGLGFLCLTDLEFCWRGLSGHNSMTSRATNLSVHPSRSERSRALIGSLRSSDTDRPGNPRSSNSLLYSSSPAPLGTRPSASSRPSRRRDNDIHLATKQVEKRQHLTDRLRLVGWVKESVELTRRGAQRTDEFALAEV